MKWIIRDLFAALVLSSSLCILLGGIGLVEGSIPLLDPNLSNQITLVGAETLEIGLIGVAVFGWFHKWVQEENRSPAALQTVPR